MFSGIVVGTGKVLAIKEHPGGRRLTIDVSWLDANIKAGDSIAVDGVCLTVVDPQSDKISFDIINETLKKTTLGQPQVNDHVNLEQSLKVGDRLDGHLVQGHADAVGHVRKKIVTDKEYALWISPPANLMPYIVPRGSIAVNGISLTVAEIDSDGFKVALIPTTLEKTNISELNEGDAVNLETDLMARQIVHWLEQQKKS